MSDLPTLSASMKWKTIFNEIDLLIIAFSSNKLHSKQNGKGKKCNE